ncbi:MAG: TonB-dependent receptor plug domain-containing protein [Myxococcales bacterium]
MHARFSGVLLTLIALGAPRARAQEAAAPAPENSEEQLLDLGYQLEQQVVSSTKTAERAVQTPAVVTVITGDEMRARGYTCLADALRWVPGFYDVNDLVTHNVGVRGINGGVGAAGDVVKVMIDGQPVDYRPTTGNFFGPELVPIEAIDRVEIIRGPASALYGANAFLGVINVITRSGADISGLELVGRGAMVRDHPGGGGDVVLGGADGKVDALVAASFLYLDRSGLSPSIVPGAAISPGPSQGDSSRPKSVLAKLSVGGVAGGKATLSASIQNLDSAAEFQEFDPLQSDSRLAVVNQNYRLLWERPLGASASLSASAYYFDGSPSPQQQLDVGTPGELLVPSVGTQGFGATLESQQRVWRLRLTEGADYVQEQNLLQSFSQLFTAGTASRPAGTLVPGTGYGAEYTFQNFGAYAQGIWQISPSFSATLGGRVDDHTLYGVNPSARAALVFAPPGSAWSGKLLYGSSFKAPSAVQLFTQPMTANTIEGNPNLRPQTAHTVELAGGYTLPKARGEITANAYVTDVLGQVEFLQSGLFFQARNIPDTVVVGGELDGQLAFGKALRLRLLAGVASTVSQDMGPDFVGTPEVYNPLFPPYQIHALLDWFLPWASLRFSPELSFIGPRAASQSNALLAGSTYELPPYFYTGASLSTAVHPFGKKVELALHVSDLLDQIWYDPGFNGLDVPSAGITAILTVALTL